MNFLTSLIFGFIGIGMFTSAFGMVPSEHLSPLIFGLLCGGGILLMGFPYFFYPKRTKKKLNPKEQR